jgi:ATP-dependent DNA helicase Q1
MTSICKSVLQVVENASTKDQRLTGLKLTESVMSKLKKTTLTRDDLEKVLIKMILKGYLREDFHFTPYSKICYLLPGMLESY